MIVTHQLVIEATDSDGRVAGASRNVFVVMARLLYSVPASDILRFVASITDW
jgi:hypothetical protein